MVAAGVPVGTGAWAWAPTRAPGAPRVSMPPNARAARRNRRFMFSSLSALRLSEARRHRVPVDRVPPGVQVVGPTVLVLQVVGVLPDVHAEDRDLAFHEGAILVRRAHDLQLAAV